MNLGLPTGKTETSAGKKSNHVVQLWIDKTKYAALLMLMGCIASAYPATVQFESATIDWETEFSDPELVYYRIYVTRTGGSSGAVSVNYATADGTATAGSDYTAKSGTLSWTDGDAAKK